MTVLRRQKKNYLPKNVRRIRILVRESRSKKLKIIYSLKMVEYRMVVICAYYLEQHELSLAASCPAPCVSRVPPAVQCGHDTSTKFRKYTVVQVLRKHLREKSTCSHVA
jgi:hypothetical protein